MANEKRLIDANALLNTLERYVNPMPGEHGNGYLSGLATAMDEVDAASTVDAKPVVHGRWFMRGGIFRCSECDSKALLKIDSNVGGCREYTHIRSNYCPNCGADMRGDGNA